MFKKRPEEIMLLQLTGIATASASNASEHNRPSISPLSHSPASSAIRGRSPSPSVENMASKSNSLAHERAFSPILFAYSPVSIGTKLSLLPKLTTSAPNAINKGL